MSDVTDQQTPLQQVRFAARLVQRILSGDYGDGTHDREIPSGAKRLAALYTILVVGVDNGTKVAHLLLRARELRAKALRYRDLVPRGGELAATLDCLEDALAAYRAARAEEVPEIATRRQADAALVPAGPALAPPETPFTMSETQADRVLDLLDRAWIAEARYVLLYGDERKATIYLRYTNPENAYGSRRTAAGAAGWRAVGRDGRESDPYESLEKLLATATPVPLEVLRYAALDGLYPDRHKARCFVCHKARTESRPLYEIGGVLVCGGHYRALAEKAIQQSRRVFYILQADYRRAEDAARKDRAAARLLAGGE